MANGIYALNDNKTKMYAYVPPGKTTAKVFKNPITIDTRGRAFVLVSGQFGTDIKEPESSNITWTVVGSKGDKYTVEKTENGLTCSCSGFKFRGNCKHIKEVA